MGYRVKMSVGISLKDKETLREVMIKRNIISVPISKKTLDYIQKNYFENIIEIVNIDTNEQIENSPITITEDTSDIEEALELTEDVEITDDSEMTDSETITDSESTDDSKTEEDKQEVEAEENKALNDSLLFLEEFNISEDEIDSIIDMGEDVDKIFINNEEGKENIVEETVNPKVVKKSENPKTESTDDNKASDEVSDEDLDIDAVLDFFAEDDPYSPDVESMSKIINP